MAATAVSSSIASVLASRASTPSRTELAIIIAATSGAPARDEGKRCPIGHEDRECRARKRGQTVEPDRRARLRHTQRFARFHRRRLQPIDADRLLVTHLILKPDIDVFARLQHLLGRLREPRSSRSTGGIWKNPGKNAISENATRTAAARRCDPTAKSSAAASPRAGAKLGRVLSVVVLTLVRLESAVLPGQ